VPRPEHYTRLHNTMLPGDSCETLALGCDAMYGVKNGDKWVTICKEDIFRLNTGQAYRKYQRLFFATKRSAQSHCDKLNRIFNTNEYEVAKI
tara:strand:- start:192 stop:467 length:276 start_codon:yes stop_codon:yes gene_type:complete